MSQSRIRGFVGDSNQTNRVFLRRPALIFSGSLGIHVREAYAEIFLKHVVKEPAGASIGIIERDYMIILFEQR